MQDQMKTDPAEPTDRTEGKCSFALWPGLDTGYRIQHSVGLISRCTRPFLCTAARPLASGKKVG